ncbi:MAG: hypothetical protein Q8L81_18565 [Bacteroidota bacterium]|nr:hypothetical protein [Bacteroidota bacterium]
MENKELATIEKKVSDLKCSDRTITELINLVDDIYIILDENHHINQFSKRLSFVKSNLASIDTHKSQKEEIFQDSKNELLAVLKEVRQ